MATIVDSYSESNQSSVIVVSAGEFSAVGQSFTGDGNVLDSAKFYFMKYNGANLTGDEQSSTTRQLFGQGQFPI